MKMDQRIQYIFVRTNNEIYTHDNMTRLKIAPNVTRSDRFERKQTLRLVLKGLKLGY